MAFVGFIKGTGKKQLVFVGIANKQFIESGIIDRLEKYNYNSE